MLSCTKKEEMPPESNSFDFRMDGSRLVPNIGIPSASASILVGDTNHKSQITAPPVYFLRGNDTYVLAQGTKIIAGNEHSSEILASVPETAAIVELIAGKSKLFAIGAGGQIHAFDSSGKALWNYSASGYDESDAHAILADSLLIEESDSALTAINTSTGKSAWYYQTIFPVNHILYNPKTKKIIAHIAFDRDAFVWNDSVQSQACDSIICFSLEGTVTSRYAARGQRIISNLCITGKQKNCLAYGYISKPANGEMRTIHLATYSGIEESHAACISDHTLSFLPTHVASNGVTVLASGFYQSGTELESGIDAFYSTDTTTLWQRRFTYPLFSPVAISESYAYFTLSFLSQATTPAKSIFYTLDLSTGKTLGELQVNGAQSGFTNSIPIPSGEYTFILADRYTPRLYFLTP